MRQILVLLGMYFDAVAVEVKTFLLLFRLAMAIRTVIRPVKVKREPLIFSGFLITSLGDSDT